MVCCNNSQGSIMLHHLLYSSSNTTGLALYRRADRALSKRAIKFLVIFSPFLWRNWNVNDGIKMAMWCKKINDAAAGGVAGKTCQHYSSNDNNFQFFMPRSIEQDWVITVCSGCTHILCWYLCEAYIFWLKCHQRLHHHLHCMAYE